MSSNPYVECQKFETADRRDREQRDEAIARANKRYEDKRQMRKDRLTTEELALIETQEKLRAVPQAFVGELNPVLFAEEPAMVGFTPVGELGADAEKQAPPTTGRARARGA